jgi:hypothetical protein
MIDSRMQSSAVWRCLLDQPVAAGSVDHVLARRLGGRSSHGFIAALLAPLQVRLDNAANDLLLSKLSYAAQAKAYRRLDEAGLAPVALKGFANAHLLYDDPVPRTIGDLDVLLERRHLRSAIELFAADGFRFTPITDKRWGLIGDASFAPFHSADAVSNIDFHIAPDAWPLPLGLTADDVRAKAMVVAGVRMPSHEHTLLIAVANAAKDKFNWRTLAKALDVARLLRRHAASMDWDEIQHRAQAARLERALGCFFALLRGLGGEAPDLPVSSPSLLAGLVEEWREGFVDEPNGATVLAREALLMHSPATSLALNFKRVKGLFAPNDGVPEEGRAYL